MRIVGLHDFIRSVWRNAKVGHEQIGYLCNVACRIYGEGGAYTMVKLLEETYPGCCYEKLIDFNAGFCGGIFGAAAKFDGENAKRQSYTTLRFNLILRLLEQPDRRLVIPEVV